MSAYKKLAVEFKNVDSLQKALTDVLGKEFEFDASLSNSLSLYGYQNDRRPEKVTARVDRKVVNARYSGGASNDFGLTYNPTTKLFEAVISEYDSGAGTMNLVNQLKQRYAFHEVSRMARLKGYSVKPIQSNDKTVRLQLVKL